ncbi:MAG: tetratricopeptide repeat protein [Thermodesulfobacteriota bacterium]
MALLFFLLGALVRAAHLLVVWNNPYFASLAIDARAYHEKALSILAGHLVGDRVFYQDPLYPYLLAFLYWIFGPAPAVARVFQALLGGGTCALVFLSARMLAGTRAAIASGAVFLLTGVFTFYDCLLGKEAVSLFLLSAFLALHLCALLTGRARTFLFSGMCLGAAALTRANVLLLAPLFALHALWALRMGMGRRIWAAALFCAGTVLLISPATLHNYLAQKDLVLVTCQGGQNFYYGNGPQAKGAFEKPDRVRLVPEYEEEDFAREAARATGKKDMKPSEISSFWFKKGVEYIREHPGATARLWAKKAAMFLASYEIPDNYYYAFALSRSRVLPYLFVPFGALFCLGLCGMALLWPDRVRFFVPAIFCAGYFASLVPFHMASRYRLPVTLVFAVCSGPFLAWTVTAVRSRRAGALTGAAAACAVLGALTFFPYPFVPKDISETFSGPYNAMGAASAEAGDYEKAIYYYYKALAIVPDYSPSLYNLGGVYIALNDPDKAAYWLTKAKDRDPFMVDAYVNLGNIYLARNEPELACPVFEEGLRHNPGNPELYEGLGLCLHQKGRFEDAATVLRKALAERPRDPKLRYNLACALARAGKKDAAQKELDAAVAENPDYRQKAAQDPDLEQLREPSGDEEKAGAAR